MYMLNICSLDIKQTIVDLLGSLQSSVLNFGSANQSMDIN